MQHSIWKKNLSATNVTGISLLKLTGKHISTGIIRPLMKKPSTSVNSVAKPLIWSHN